MLSSTLPGPWGFYNDEQPNNGDRYPGDLHQAEGFIKSKHADKKAEGGREKSTPISCTSDGTRCGLEGRQSVVRYITIQLADLPSSHAQTRAGCAGHDLRARHA